MRARERESMSRARERESAGDSDTLGKRQRDFERETSGNRAATEREMAGAEGEWKRREGGGDDEKLGRKGGERGGGEGEGVRVLAYIVFD